MAKNTTQPKEKKSIIPALLILLATALLITIPILASIKTGPVDRLKKAIDSTVFAKNFTMKFSTDINGEVADGVVTVSIDTDNRNLGMFLELTTFSGDFEGGIHEGTFVMRSGADGTTTTTDISEQVDNFFALLEQGTVDWQALLDFPEGNLHDKLSEDLDFHIFLDCLGQWLNTANNKNWAKKNAGYSKSSADGVTTYWFKPDLHTLASQSAPVFETAFRDPQRYQDLLDYTENAKYLLKDGTMNLSFRVQGGLLTAMDFSLQYNKTDMRCNLVFSDVGSTIVDTGTVAFYIDQANDDSDG